MEETTIISSQHNECLDWGLEQIEQSIVAHSYDMARSMLEIGKALKAIADGKKYTEKGYSSFKEYMEDASAHTFPFSYSQARKHIRVYERFGGRLSELNCAKIEVLDILRDIPEEDFEKLNDSGELNSLSKREAEELKAKLEAANEQISLLSAEKDKITADCNSFKAERDEYYEQMKELESRPVETVIAEPSEELLRSIREEAAKEAEKNMVSAKSEYEEAIKKLKKEKKVAESRVKEIEEAHKKELDDMSASLGADKAATDERIKELERKLQSAEKPADSELIEFKFYFAETQDNLKKFLNALGKVSDPEKKEKFKGAAIKFVEAILGDLKKES
jgi:chromosome segregation ATPase